MAAEDPPPGVLNADEYAFLARYGAAVSQARDPALRKAARAAAVAAARPYHDRGITWTEIAGALGVPPQARLFTQFTQRFYAGLAAGATAGKAFDGPLITVTTRWPGQAEPYLSGNALTVPFPPCPAPCATFP